MGALDGAALGLLGKLIGQTNGTALANTIHGEVQVPVGDTWTVPEGIFSVWGYAVGQGGVKLGANIFAANTRVAGATSGGVAPFGPIAVTPGETLNVTARSAAANGQVGTVTVTGWNAPSDNVYWVTGYSYPLPPYSNAGPPTGVVGVFAGNKEGQPFGYIAQEQIVASTDSVNWSALNIGLTGGTSIYSQVLVTPNDGNVVLAGWNSSSNVMSYNIGTNTITDLQLASNNSDGAGLWADPSNDRLYTASVHLFTAPKGSNVWTNTGLNMPAPTRVRALSVGANSRVFAIGATGNAAYAVATSADNGATWSNTGVIAQGVLADPETGIVHSWATSVGANTKLSQDNGATWANCAIVASGMNVLCVSNGYVFAAAYNVAGYTNTTVIIRKELTDTAWTVLPNQVGGNVYSLASGTAGLFELGNDNTLYVTEQTSNSVWFSGDNGDTWNNTGAAYGAGTGNVAMFWAPDPVLGSVFVANGTATAASVRAGLYQLALGDTPVASVGGGVYSGAAEASAVYQLSAPAGAVRGTTVLGSIVAAAEQFGRVTRGGDGAAAQMPTLLGEGDSGFGAGPAGLHIIF